VQRAAADATRGAHNAREAAAKIFWWVKRRMTFRRDEDVLAATGTGYDEQDLLMEPAWLLSIPNPAGDCDDYTTLTCSMLLAAGIPSRITTIAADSQEPGRFSHVFCEAELPCGKTLALDTSHGQYPGWQSPKQFRRQSWPIIGVSGLGMLHGVNSETWQQREEPCN
jgi:transglutaminase-like putative cysteine protease